MFQIRHISGALSLGILDLAAFAKQEGLYIKREQEKAGAQFVLKNLLAPEAVQLAYTGHNKPYLADHPAHISISHSHNRLVVLLNREKNTGVDIELIRDKVLKIRHKFLNAREAAFAGQDVRRLITIWAAKEAMYKHYGLKQLDFIANLSVQDFEDSVIFGNIETQDYKKAFQLMWEQLDDYILVYILDEI